MAGLGRRLARLDVGRLRFHNFPADHVADLAGVQRPADGRHRGFHPHPVDAPGRRHRRRLACRPDRAQDAADDLDRVVFSVQLHRRVFTDFLVPVSVPGVARHRHGGGMALRSRIGDGKLADPLARFYGRRPAILVGPRRPAVQRRLRPALYFDRLARPADDRRPAGVVDRLCPPLCQRAAGLGRKPPVAAPTAARGQGAATQDLQAGCSPTR